MKQQLTKGQFKFKDPFSAISHLAFSILAIIATPPLLYLAYQKPGKISIISMILFMLGVILLYSASAMYHSFDISDVVNTRLKKIDHMMIYILIAGSYSPICLVGLENKTGFLLFFIIWGLAFFGLFQAIFFIHAPKWVNSVIYIAMGWSCVFAGGQIKSVLSASAFFWLLHGGIIYTVGGVIYALKLPLFNKRHKNFTTHDLFHLFCIGGSVSHYILMLYLLQ
jgi:hemolysin III